LPAYWQWELTVFKPNYPKKWNSVNKESITGICWVTYEAFVVEGLKDTKKRNARSCLRRWLMDKSHTRFVPGSKYCALQWPLSWKGSN